MLSELFFQMKSVLSQSANSKMYKRQNYGYIISVRWQAHLRDPKPNPNPQNQVSSKKKLVQKSQKQGVLTVNIIPSSHKSAKIAIFSCQKSRVPNKIET